MTRGWQPILQLLRAPLGPLTEADAAFLDAWLRRRDATAAFVGFLIGSVFHVTALAITWLFVSPTIGTPFLWVNGGFLLTQVLWFVLREKLPVDERKVAWALSLLYMPAVMGLSAWAVPQATLQEKLMFAATIILVCKTSILICPLRGVVPYASAAYYAALATWFFHGTDFGGLWLQVFIGSMGFTLLFHNAHIQSAKREAIKELRAREALAAAERAHIERELALARQIQDSLQPDETQKSPGYAVRWFHAKHEQVGGDWLALRPLPEGGLAAVVADATGKGLQAALVIHALQALWADALADPQLAPQAWLARVNRTLRTLGAAQAQTLTLGLAIVEHGRITYWSAGHVPLFLRPQPRSLVPLVGRGPLLGMNESLDLQPVSHAIAADSPLTVLLGSDGVFPKGTLTRSVDVEQLLARLEARGDAGLRELPQDDDKTLVVIRKAA